MSKKILKFQPQGWIHQGGGKFGWSENFNEHPIVNFRFCKQGVDVDSIDYNQVRLLTLLTIDLLRNGK